MTRGQGPDIDRAAVVAAVAAAEDDDRSETTGAVHTSTVAEMLAATVGPVETHCQALAEDGILREQYDLGPVGPRRCYRVADPAAGDEGDDDEGRVYV